jgi:transposase
VKGPKVQALQRADLERLLERARPALSAAQYEQLKAALDTGVYLTPLLGKKNTTIGRLRPILFGARSEKTAEVLKSLVGKDPPAGEASSAATVPGAGGAKDAAAKAPGHGRNGAKDYPGANTVVVEHASLKPGEICPECRRGKLYEMEPGVLWCASPLRRPWRPASTRCRSCAATCAWRCSTRRRPRGSGPRSTTPARRRMIALSKYGSGVPFYRLAGLQEGLGIPLPASTQWEIVEKRALRVKPALEELIGQAAQGEVLHDEDTPMKILGRMKQAEDSQRPPQRTGIYTTGIVSRREGRTIALFFTGKGHAGENLAPVLAQRAAELAPPIQMCDGLEHDVPKAFQSIVANCMAHSSRKYVEVAPRFPEQCQFVLETLAQVYRHDARCKQQKLSPGERLAFHRSHSQPSMDTLETWLTEQIEQHKGEPNGGLGEAIGSMRKHWKALTLFLRKAGAPLDDNLCEQI